MEHQPANSPTLTLVYKRRTFALTRQDAKPFTAAFLAKQGVEPYDYCGSTTDGTPEERLKGLFRRTVGGKFFPIQILSGT